MRATGTVFHVGHLELREIDMATLSYVRVHVGMPFYVRIDVVILELQYLATTGVSP